MKEKLLELLEHEFDALDIITISEKLNLNSVEDLRIIGEELTELVNDLIVYQTKKNKYILYTKCPNFRKGKISINKKGFGFVILEDEEDIHVSFDNLGLSLDGDLVLVEIIDAAKKEGRIIKVLERDLKNIVGEIKSNGHNLFFEPKKHTNITIYIDNSEFKKCVEGEIVVVTLTDDLGKNKYNGIIGKRICHKDDPTSDILTIAAKYDIYDSWPEAVKIQLESIPSEVRESDLVDRTDLRNEMIFTIDGADTKDIDDAISYDYDEKTNIHTLGVHIADVSYYVTEGSALDQEVTVRGTSSYLASSVIPMLPHQLSNGICSLNPNVDRLALSCVMKIDNNGHILDTDIFPSVIKSNKKMTYKSVNHIIEEDIIDEGYEPFADKLKQMNNLAHILRKERIRRGASDFDVPEPKIICDENGKCIGVEKRTRGEGERLIEDFMIAANEAVAKRFAVLSLPGIYRVHDIPKQEKIQQFLSFCSLNGITVKGKFQNMNPKMMQKLMDQIVDKLKDNESLLAIVRAMAIRCMPKAVYSSNNIGHFGLASVYYTHFTSPIRRRPDLQTHRNIRNMIFNPLVDKKQLNYYEANMESICKESSEREQAAVQAERDVDKMKMAEYMESHIGEQYKGIICGVTGVGLFIQLPNLVEGLIPVACLNDDYYEFVPELQCFIGKSTKKRYSIGEELDVVCVAARKENSQIDFDLLKNVEKRNKNDRDKK